MWLRVYLGWGAWFLVFVWGLGGGSGSGAWSVPGVFFWLAEASLHLKRNGCRMVSMVLPPAHGKMWIE